MIKTSTHLRKLNELATHERACLLYGCAEERDHHLASCLRSLSPRDDAFILLTGSTDPPDAVVANASHLDPQQRLVQPAHNYFFTNDVFDVTAGTEKLARQIETIRRKGPSELFIAIDMAWAVEDQVSEEQLLTLEIALNRCVIEFPFRLLSLYDRRLFPAEQLQRILVIHPLVIVSCQICRNLHYTPPEIFLEQGGIDQIDYQLESILLTARTDQQLRQSETNFRGLFENAMSGIFQSSPEGKLLTANHALAEILGYDSAADLLKTVNEHSIETVLYPNPGMRDDIISQVLGPERKTFFSTTLKRKNGELISVHQTVIPVRDERGKLSHFEGAILDVSQQLEIRENLNRFKTIVETSHEAIIVNDSHNRLIYANAACRKLFSAIPSPGGNFLFEHLATDSADALKGEILPKLCQGDSWEGTLYVRRTSGESLPVWCRADGLRDADGRLQQSFYLIHDDSERKAMENDIRRSNADLEQFVYTVSHDFQEPLRMVASFTDLLAKRYKHSLDENGRQFIRYILDGTGWMKELLNSLLQYSRIGTRSLTFTAVDCNEIIATVQRNLHFNIEESGAEITCAQLPVIRGDAPLLTQLFTNLIQNAIKFSGDRTPRIAIDGAEGAGETIISVTDNGIGIPAEFREDVFLIFRRLQPKGDTPGTGTGLAICKRIVELHHGSIRIDAAVPHGTVFRVALPQHDAQRNPTTTGDSS